MKDFWKSGLIVSMFTIYFHHSDLWLIQVNIVQVLILTNICIVANWCAVFFHFKNSGSVTENSCTAGENSFMSCSVSAQYWTSVIVITCNGQRKKEENWSWARPENNNRLRSWCARIPTNIPAKNPKTKYGVPEVPAFSLRLMAMRPHIIMSNPNRICNRQTEP